MDPQRSNEKYRPTRFPAGVTPTTQLSHESSMRALTEVRCDSAIPQPLSPPLPIAWIR